MTSLTENKSTGLTKQENKLIRSVFTRSMWLMFCTSYTKQQGTTFAWTMIPYLEDIYGKETDEFYASMARHQNFFNTTPGMSPFIFALVIAMEQERKAALDNGKEFDDAAIESIKVALMGPLAGIGDSIFVGALRIIAIGVAIGFSQSGSWLGPILFLLVFNIPNLLIRYFATYYGFKVGTSFISQALESGAITAFTKGFSIMGLIMTGAMTAQYVSFTTTFAADFGETTFVLQTVLDSILPGMLPLGITMAAFVYLRKHNNPVKLLVIMFIASVVLTLLGICG
ncbi:PTS system mannose/fructose/sorbose family transporter subunit IID [Tannockella kyphosi]|uniref:PTS system mannose/fructose/sorbose family transporter subunit IID n=1 Tax=Tannockella kyphosi TaxID=2899121 RepID=UPI0020119099|nr:PTS system mannose/fructose/sorbose family transporter subunit IID [Tannockella kyphosi]